MEWHPEKASLQIVERFEGGSNVMEFRTTHSEKADSSIRSTLPGMQIDFRELQQQKAETGIELSREGDSNAIAVSERHVAKQKGSRLSMEDGKTVDDRWELTKARSPIAKTDDGDSKVREVKALDSNADGIIRSISQGIDTAVSAQKARMRAVSDQSRRKLAKDERCGLSGSTCTKRKLEPIKVVPLTEETEDGRQMENREMQLVKACASIATNFESRSNATARR
jgi:hypothetical protein